MKKFVIAALLALALSGPVYAQNASAISRTITVTGDAAVRVVPDQVQISMTAENRAADLMMAKAQNDQAVKALVEYATKTLGIEARHVQTDFLTVEPTYRTCNYDDEMSGKCSPLQITYYTVRKGVQICLKDLTKYEGLVTKALQLGINRIDDIQFVTTDLRKHRDKAREMAAKAALEKAQALATSLDMKVGKPITINAENYSSYYWHGNYGGQRNNNSYMAQNAIQQAPAAPMEGDTGDLAIGQINVSAQVNVTYELQ
ncbi:MAG TPA: SIMPL domain-containing protein [Patescibacteria group bacterium]|nr:SIMPL domain-containing protein [Patescibacteria group bacterium]